MKRLGKYGRFANRPYMILLLLFLPGCAAWNAGPPNCMPDTDRRIFNCGVATLDFYAARSAKAKVLGTSAAIALSGISTAGTAMNSLGAGPGAIASLVTAGNLLGQSIGIVEPTERANAYDDGVSDLTSVLADYMDASALADNPNSTPVATKVQDQGYTKYGALLLRKIGAVKNAVNAQLKTIRPDKAVLDFISKSFIDILADAEANAAAAAEKRAQAKAAREAARKLAAPPPAVAVPIEPVVNLPMIMPAPMILPVQ